MVVAQPDSLIGSFARITPIGCDHSWRQELLYLSELQRSCGYSTLETTTDNDSLLELIHYSNHNIGNPFWPEYFYPCYLKAYHDFYSSFLVPSGRLQAAPGQWRASRSHFIVRSRLFCELF